MKSKVMQWFVRLIRLDMSYFAGETEFPLTGAGVRKSEMMTEKQ
jgi:hypothetical protein